MVGQDDVWHAAQSCQLRVGDHVAHAVIIVQAVLVFQHVQRRAAQLSAFQPGDEGIAVDQLAAGGVDDHRAGLHGRNGFGIDQMMVLLRGVGVQGNDVAFSQQGLQRHILGDLLHLVVLIQVVGQQAAAEAGQVLQHRAADASRADDAHRAGGDVPADLTLQGVILCFAPLEDMPGLAQAHEHEHNGKVGHTVGRVVHIGHLHAQLPGSLAVHMVVANGTAADDLDPQLMEPAHHGRAHIAGRHRNSIVPGGQRGVFQRGILLRIAEFNAHLRCQTLCKTQFIVGAQRVEKDFCRHRISLPF